MLFEHVAEFFLSLDEPCAVDLLLLRRHLADHAALDLVRQLLQDVFLEAAQDERHDVALEVLHGALVFFLDDRHFIARLEAVVVQQIARHQEIENRPELRQRVFHRRARQREIIGGLELFDGARGLRRRILDVLRLVEEDIAERAGRIEVDVAPQHVVRRDQHIALRARRREQLLALGFRASDDFRAELRREALGLVEPVVDERGRRDYQRRRTPTVALREQERQHLQRLAEAHVVCENATEAVVRKARQPVEARDLVVAQDFFEALRHVGFDVGILRIADVAHDAAECLAAFEMQALVLTRNGVEHHRIRKRQESLAVLVGNALFEPRRLDKIGEAAELLLAERHERAVLHAVVAAPLAVVLEDGEDFIKVDVLHRERDFEQAFLAHRDARRDLRHRLHGLLLECVSIVDFGFLRERGQCLRQEVVAPCLVLLHIGRPFGREAIRQEVVRDFLLATVIAHEDTAVSLFLRPFRCQRIELLLLI